MRLLYWLVILLLAVLLALFAASNRETVALGLWPLASVLQLPLYLVVLAALLLGLGAGVLGGWIAGGERRREARRGRRRITALERELTVTQARLPPVGDAAPAPLAPRG
jgi:uncharacterized integral membrane protein